MPIKSPVEERRMAEAFSMLQYRNEVRVRFQARPVEVGLLRRRLGLSQAQFAARFGFPVATLRHWERGDRQPRGAALVLLNVIAQNPGAVMRALKIEL